MLQPKPRFPVGATTGKPGLEDREKQVMRTGPDATPEEVVLLPTKEFPGADRRQLRSLGGDVVTVMFGTADPTEITIERSETPTIVEPMDCALSQVSRPGLWACFKENVADWTPTKIWLRCVSVYPDEGGDWIANYPITVRFRVY